MRQSKGKTAVIMAAAVADFTPKKVSSTKIKKEAVGSPDISVELKKTKDILRDLSLQKNHCKLIGFSLETHNELQNAKKKLKEKKLDLIILNNPLKEGAAFGSETNIITIISKSGKVEKLQKMSKFDAAHQILNRVVKIL